MTPAPRATRFTGELEVRFLAVREDHRPYGELLNQLAWEVVYSGAAVPADAATHPNWVVVPRGFVSDGASVPRVMWWFIPAWGHPIIRAALLHDWLIDCIRRGVPHPAYPNRLAVDNVFYDAARAVDTSAFVARVAWCVVRANSRLKGYP